ncbi:hypothetical protein IFM89_022124 [Coptis chinensis]|uniref:60S ribosomal protein L39 n=1 Tax=Coptis chinensis TaxID=261450 RepID=A0A835LCB6_9MAGN|nr:hypothetical protein IFM89_022124 [Coptis chinensis]
MSKIIESGITYIKPNNQIAGKGIQAKGKVSPDFLHQEKPSHKSFMIKKKLAKKMRQNKPIPHWIRMRLDSTIRTETVLLDWLTGLATLCANRRRKELKTVGLDIVHKIVDISSRFERI